MNRRSSFRAPPCPSAETVRDFLSDCLMEPQESEVASHLESCGACQLAAERQMAGQGQFRAPKSTCDVPRALLERMYALAEATEDNGPSATMRQASEAGDSEDPRQVGRFVIERRLGVGGFGIVLLAYDPILNRRVALKLPRLPRVLDVAQRARFQREAQAAAGLHHGHIVPVYEAGEADGLHYLAADYCPGPNLAHWLAEQPAPVAPQQAAGMVAMLAEAVEHAHQRGVLHRDIKPSNVLLDSRTSSPGLPFTPKLTDFGLAKLLNGEADATLSGQLIGTPRYMAPEQACGERGRIGPPSDVYALGVILYELLTKCSPIEGADNVDTLRRVLTDQPVRVRARNPRTPRDLEAISLRCLEKDPEQRYRSAGELAEDLRRFLVGRPTAARPVSVWRRAVRHARRKPAQMAAATLVALLAIGAAVLWQVHEAQQRQLAASQVRDQEQSAEIVRRGNELDRVRNLHNYVAGIRQVELLLKNTRADLASDALSSFRPTSGQEDLREFAWHYLCRRATRTTRLPEPKQIVAAVCYRPDRIVVAGDDTISFLNPGTHELIRSIKLGKPRAGEAWFSADARRLVTSSPSREPPKRVYCWDTDNGELVGELTIDWHYDQAAISPDGRHVAIAGGVFHEVARVLLWDPQENTTEALVEIPTHKEDMGIATAVEFSADGKLLAVAFNKDEGGTPPLNWTCMVLDLATKSVQAKLMESRGMINSVAFSSAGDRVATFGQDGKVTVWDWRENQRALEYGVPDDCLGQMTFSPDGELLAVGLCPLDKAIQGVEWLDVRDLRTGERQPVGLLERAIVSARFAPDGQTLALGSMDGLRLADLSVKDLPTAVAAHSPTEAWGIAFAPSGGIFATSGDDGCARLWDRNLRELRKLEVGTLALKVAFAPDRPLVAAAAYDGAIRLWNHQTGEEEKQLLGHTGPVRSIAFNPRGEWLASAGDDGAVQLWNVDKQALERTLREAGPKVRTIAFSPDGSELFSSGNDGIVSIWDYKQGALLRAFEETVATWALAHSPVERLLAVGTRLPEIELRRTDSRELVSRLVGHTQGVRCLAFSPDGRTLASASLDQSVRLWHVATGEELLAFEKLPGQINDIAFSSDGRTLGAACHDGSVRLWKTD